MLPSGRRRDLEGPTRERSEGTASFHQLREYVPGDDLRRIHWRSTARTGDLLVKQMVDTTRPELVVVLDNRAAAVGADDFEEAVDIVASVVAAAEDDDFPVALVLTDGSSDVDGDGQRIPPIDRLTAVALGDADSLERLAEVLMARGRSLLVRHRRALGRRPAGDRQAGPRLRARPPRVGGTRTTCAAGRRARDEGDRVR